jgi:preprotein translocase subunit SecG
MLAFQWPGWLIGVLIAMFLAVCIIMVLTVLIQKPQGGGLASAFGGGVSAGQTAFGTKTGDALTVFTIAIFITYLLLAITLDFATRPVKVVATDAKEVLPADGKPPASSDSSKSEPAQTEPAQTAPGQPAPATGTAPADGKPAEPAPAVTPITLPAPTPQPVSSLPAPTPSPTPSPSPSPAAPK